MTTTNDDGRIPFDSGDTDSVPPSWAGGMLTYIKRQYPEVFAEALTHTLGIELPKKRTRAQSKNADADTGTPAPPLSVASGQHARAS